MTPRLVILTEIISPYRIPLFNALHEGGAVKLHVIFLAETDPELRQWQVCKEGIKFSYQVLPAWRKRIGRYNVLVNRNVARALDKASPDAILCGGYNYVASWQSLLWARRRRVPFLLWSESNLQDARRGHAIVELMKAEFLHRCDGFVVPGKSASAYLRTHNIEGRFIFTAVNAVDNGYFAATAENTRQNPDEYREALSLPRQYFLFVGRLVREKGVFDLLAAYARLNEPLRESIALVYVGDGPARQELEKQALPVSPGNVKFAGFIHQEDLGKYYALAEALILPTYTDTWGLVVNEAMACGLPIVLSEVAGCAADLVTDGWNGLLIPPGNSAALAAAMTRIATGELRRADMSANSLQRISGYTAREWSLGVSRAIHAVVGAND